MEIINKQILCREGDFANEDVAGINEYGAWILDGATGLSGAKLTNEKSDARWYTKWWDSYLSNYLKDDLPIAKIIANGIHQVSIDFHKAIGNKLCSKLDYPSSSIIVLKWHENNIEYFSLGDSPLIIQKSDSLVEITDKIVPVLDEKVFVAIEQAIMEHNITSWEAKKFVLPMLKEHRMLLNTEEGYWILGFDTKAVSKASQGIININESTKILMASDGFSAFVDKYHAVEKKDFISQAEDNGLAWIYNQIRAIEDLDNDGIKYPRYKKSDDSSAVFFQVNP